MYRLPRTDVLRYGSAVIGVALATAARLALDPLLGDLFPFATLFLAVLVVAGYGGRGPALLAIGLGALASARFLLPPRVDFTVQGFENRAGLVLYLVVGLGVALLGGALREARRRAEADADEAVRQREQSQITLASIGDAVLVTDAEGRVTSLNPVAEGLTGWSASETAGESLPTIFRIVNEETRQPVENPALRALREGAVVGLANHTLLISKDGTERPIDDSAAPIKNSSGRVVGAVLVFRDVSDRRRAEASIAEQVRLAEYGRDVGRAMTQGGTAEEVLARCAEATVRHLDGAFARIWTADEAGEVLELQASAGMYTHTDGPHARVPVGQYKIGRIAQQRKSHLTNSVIGDPSVPAQDWAKAEGMVAFAGYPLVVDDHLVGVLAMFARHELSDAALRMMGSVADEIAVGIDRMRAEERLHRQGEWLRVMLASIGDAVIATDLDGRVTFLNGVAEDLTGWPQNEAAGRDLAEVFRIVNERTRREVESPAIRALREGQIVGLANHTILIARDGSERAIDDSAAPIRDEAGSVMGAVLIFRDVDEKRQAGRALEASEARKAAILDTALDAIITIDHEGNVAEWNPAAERLFGHERSAVLGREMCGLIIPPSLREAHRRGLARYLQIGEGPVLGKRIEITAVRADGSEFPIELAITPISAGGPPAFTAHIRDITDRKSAERRRNTRLAVTEVLAGAGTPGEAAAGVLRAVCEGLGWDVGAFWTVDQGGGVLHCLEFWSSPSAAAGPFEAASRVRTYAIGVGLPGRVWGTGRAAWIPDVTVEPNFPRAPLAAEAGLHGAFAAPITAGEEFLGVVEFYSDEVRQPDPDLLEMMGTLGGQVGQFVKRRRAEDRLWRSERELADFFENATVGLHWVGPDGTILRANRAELDLLGYGREEYVGRPIAEFHADEDAICDILRRLQEGEALHDYPARLRCKDGAVKDVLIDSSVMREGDEFVHTRCFTRDVTERKRFEDDLRHARDEAEAANRAKSQFLAVLSHELRTPLNPILLATTAMLERPADADELRPTLEMIRQNVNLQARLIDDLLDVMRIVRGKMPLHWEVADCHRVIDQSIQICRSEVSGHDLRLSVEADARHHHINADAARLQQVFWNLIKNAVKFTPEGGSITVRTRNEGGDGEGRIVVEVIDTGIGIEPEVLPTIWDPFQQGETTITRKFGGLGLGLAICKGVIEAHGGTLEAESPGKGRGTTFRVGLKVLPEAAIEGNGQPVGDPLAIGPHRRTSLRILVVEDEPATLRLMERLLRGLGHAVTTANTIASGCKAFESGEFDLIVSDIGLPDGTGLDLMRRVVALRGQVPSIALTGYGMEDDIVRSQEAGFTAHMTKPIDFTKLEAMIRQVASAGGEVRPASPRDAEPDDGVRSESRAGDGDGVPTPGP